MQGITEYAIFIDPKSLRLRDGFGGLEISIVRITEEGVRNPSTDDPFDNLVISAQWDRDDHSERTYGWDVRYRNVFAVDKQDAERMVKMFRRIERVEKKFPVWPTSFGQYVSLMAQGLGIRSARRRSLNSLDTGNYSQMELQVWRIQEVAGVIDSMIQETRTEKGEVHAA